MLDMKPTMFRLQTRILVLASPAIGLKAGGPRPQPSLGRAAHRASNEAAAGQSTLGCQFMSIPSFDHFDPVSAEADCRRAVAVQMRIAQNLQAKGEHWTVGADDWT